MGFNKSHITTVLYSTLALVAIAFLYFEWLQLNNNRSNQETQIIAAESVNESFEQLQNQIFNFSSASTEFANSIAEQLVSNTDLTLPNIIQSDFWGAAVFEAGNPIYWQDYASIFPLDSLDANNNELILERRKEGNVQFLQSIIPITNIQNSDTVYYQVYTRLLLDQHSEFDITGNQPESDIHQMNSRNSFPVRISYSSVRQDSVIHSRTFFSVSGDFIALVYASESDIETFVNSENERIRNIRSYFILSIVALFTILIAWMCRKLNFYLQLLLQWSFLILIHFLQSPISTLLFNDIFISKMIDFGFIVAGFLCLYRLINNRYLGNKSSKSAEVYLLSILNGVAIAALLIFALHDIFSTILLTELNLFNQILTSSLLSTTWILIIGTALLIPVSLFNHSFLKGIKYEQTSSLGIFCSTIFGISFPTLISYLLAEDLGIDSLIIWISGSVLVAVLVLTLFQFRIRILTYKVSLIRVLLTILTIVSSSITATIYYSFDEVLFTKLVNNSKVFEEDNEDRIRLVISELLDEAYAEVRSISLYSVSNFEQIIDNLIEEDWLKYSFSLQLIDKSGAPLAAYNTNLSVPQWTTDYRIEELIIPYEEERIRKENIRPILRSQPINTVNAEYSYFMRGWIPLYQSRRSENISGWILATLYQEIPELNRPFRSVVNATIQSPEETAFTFTEYKNGIPTRSIVSGTLTSIPDYGMLPSTIQDYMTGHQEWVQNPTIQDLKLKERFSKTITGTIIRGAHLQITLPQVLYVFLRVYFTVAIPFILLLVILTGSKILNSISESRRIRDRLMDRSIIASIACLFLLIGATSLILESQNKSEVQEALRDQLLTLSETLTEADEISTDFLENITAVLGVDASLYFNGRLENSTTPPIYNQHLIPSTIPWNIYQRIVFEGSQLDIDIFSIGDQELMIGYQPWLNAENQIAGIVAIPTFLKTPDFYSRLLSTTSYLLAFYSLIFGVLILMIGFISARITAPLETLEAGLEKISAGDLNTRLKIQSNDEIGMLTQAYNSMASKLKTLQDELAQSEREAAWKQMAQQVAHEIKNPLTPMKLNLQHLERQLHQTGEELNLDKPRVAAITKSMIEQIEALNKIASDFSKFAKPSSKQFEEIKVNELIASVVMMYSDHGTNITTQFDTREFIISGVSEELRRALVNLIKNAQEAIPEEGIISLQTSWNKSGKTVEISIHDNGKGIPENEATNIFLPNFSTKTSGTGLGLAITRKIIEEHSGSISFSSELGKGTTFTITLPLKNS